MIIKKTLMQSYQEMDDMDSIKDDEDLTSQKSSSKKKSGNLPPKRAPGTSISKSKRSGLEFPVGKIQRLLKADSKLRVGAQPAIYTAAALEYVVKELVTTAGEKTEAEDRKRIKPKDIQAAIDDPRSIMVAMKKLLNLLEVSLAEGGVSAESKFPEAKAMKGKRTEAKAEKKSSVKSSPKTKSKKTNSKKQHKFYLLK